jgi:maltose O-acetyltransferase
MRFLTCNLIDIISNVTIIDSDSHELDYMERDEGFRQMIEKGHPLARGNVMVAPIVIGDHVWISYNVCILKGVTIGKGAIIGAGSVVTKDVPPFTVYAGTPARYVRNII